MKMTIEIDTEHDAPLVDAVMKALEGLKTEVARSAPGRAEARASEPQRPDESPYQAASRKIRENFENTTKPRRGRPPKKREVTNAL